MCEQHGQKKITRNLSERRKTGRAQSAISAIVKMASIMVDKHELTGAAREIRKVNPVYLR